MAEADKKKSRPPRAKGKGKATFKMAPAASTPAKPAPKKTPTPAQQAEAWQALSADQQLSLREREAARMFALASDQLQKGNATDAVQNYGKAALLNPKSWDIYINLGVALRKAGKLDAAVACYRRGLVLKPDHGGLYSNLGNVLRELGRTQNAVSSHQQAVRFDPENPEAFFNLGLSLADLNEFKQAIICYDKALMLKPDHPRYILEKGRCLIRLDNYIEGFKDVEARWKIEGVAAPDYDKPEWDGTELKGKTILIHPEPDASDMIRFARYLLLVKQRGGTVVVQVGQGLARLFSTVPGVDKVVIEGAPLPRFDMWAGMMSLARIFETTVKSIPDTLPYFRPPELLAVQLPASMETQKKVGVIWSSISPRTSNANVGFEFRDFISLMGLPGMAMFSLQLGAPAKDIEKYGCQALLSDLSRRIDSYSAMASVFSQLDLLISTDCAEAQIAASLGVPVWLVLPPVTSWRWPYEGSDTPWYPGMRLFRQKPGQSPDIVFSEIERALGEEIG